MQQVHPLFLDPLHAPANNQALEALVHIRDNLLFSLISELSGFYSTEPAFSQLPYSLAATKSRRKQTRKKELANPALVVLT